MYFKTKLFKVLKYLLCVCTLCDGPYNFMLLLQSSKIFRLKTGLSFSACYHAKVAFLEKPNLNLIEWHHHLDQRNSTAQFSRAGHTRQTGATIGQKSVACRMHSKYCAETPF